jgi:predicted transcriptional regulator
MVCPKYARLRDKMRKKVGLGGMRLAKLLGDH